MRPPKFDSKFAAAAIVCALQLDWSNVQPAYYDVCKYNERLNLTALVWLWYVAVHIKVSRGGWQCNSHPLKLVS